MARFKQGYYTPNNPHKYAGDVSKIRYMSSWELSMHVFLDNNTQIIKWASECIAIPYIKPTDNKLHRYYPDYYIMYMDKHGKVRQIIVEVKPDSQTKVSKAKKKQNKMYDDITLAINIAKWQACQNWCNQQGFEFQIITEKQMFR
jgi:hypothetical protein